MFFIYIKEHQTLSKPKITSSFFLRNMSLRNIKNEAENVKILRNI